LKQDVAERLFALGDGLGLRILWIGSFGIRH
jgi:hypothetical protein